MNPLIQISLISDFIYYALRPALSHFQSASIGKRLLRSLTKGILEKFSELALPSISEQDRIASILSAYDDLIENNRRRIALLEQAARLLYREWFVHLRFPGHEHVRIEDGVPEGWEEDYRRCARKYVQLRQDRVQTISADNDIAASEHSRRMGQILSAWGTVSHGIIGEHRLPTVISASSPSSFHKAGGSLMAKGCSMLIVIR